VRLIKNQIELDSDVLVVGGGTAGCLAAMAAREQGAQVVVVEKGGSITRSGSCASGMDHYNVILGEGPWDTPEAHLESLANSRPGLTDMRVAAVYARENKRVFDYLESIGVPFRDGHTGRYLRIAGMGGKNTQTVSFEGARIKPVMAAQVKKLASTVIERVAVLGLLTRSGRVVGALGFQVRSGELFILRAKAVVIATGGAGRLYPPPYGQPFAIGHPPYNTGDGHIMAFQAGAALTNMEFIGCAVSPKGFNVPGITGFLSMGAYLLNSQGERYMFRYHPWGEHAPRNLVAYAMYKEYEEGRGPCYVDCRHLAEEAISFIKRGIRNERITLLDYFAARGIDIGRDPIPFEIRRYGVEGTGLRIDAQCASTAEGLFAAGDCTNTTYALSGACTFGFVAGATAAEEASMFKGEVEVDRRQVAEFKERVFAPLATKEGVHYSEVEEELRIIMVDHVGFIREESGLQRAVDRLKVLKGETGNLKAGNYHELMRANETRNLVDAAFLVATAARERKESRVGLSHNRLDFPEKDDEHWRRFIVLNRDSGGGVRVSFQPMPGLEG
jgi:adenylylsulfate reductase subunit A